MARPERLGCGAGSRPKTRAEILADWRRDLATDPRAAREIIVELHRSGAEPRTIASALRECRWPRGERP